MLGSSRGSTIRLIRHILHTPRARYTRYIAHARSTRHTRHIAQSVLGYDLGTGESISGTIVIGLSVDYTVHLGNIYTESARTSREGKMQDAASVMGPTVVAGGITTLG